MRIEILLEILCLPSICQTVIQCFEYSHTKPDIKNKTKWCPYPADTCYTEKTTDGFLLRRNCIWEGHCTERNICGVKSQCNLHCCHKDLCNHSNSLLITENSSMLMILMNWLIIFCILCVFII